MRKRAPRRDLVGCQLIQAEVHERYVLGGTASCCGLDVSYMEVLFQEEEPCCSIALIESGPIQDQRNNTSYTETIVPTTAIARPATTNTKLTDFSTMVSLDPNICKCAAAGKTTETAIVHIIPTREL